MEEKTLLFQECVFHDFSRAKVPCLRWSWMSILGKFWNKFSKTLGMGNVLKRIVTGNVTTRLVTTETYLFLMLCWGYPTAAGIALYVVLWMGVPRRMCPHVPMEVLRVLSAQAQLSNTLSLNFVIKARCEPRGKFANLAGFFLGFRRFWRNLKAALMESLSFFLSDADKSRLPFNAKRDCWTCCLCNSSRCAVSKPCANLFEWGSITFSDWMDVGKTTTWHTSLWKTILGTLHVQSLRFLKSEDRVHWAVERCRCLKKKSRRKQLFEILWSYKFHKAAK